MGLFDVQGGTCLRPTYQLGSPQFDRIEIKLNRINATGRRFIIETSGNGKENLYVQSATLNGKPLNQCWIYRDEIFQGGRLHLQMGRRPNEKWGNGAPVPCPQ